MKISVVMPVYNAEKYLDEAIQSILNQTYKDYEFIIINDGSTDKSLSIIEKYKDQDERIVLISRENRGIVASLNEGIQKAKGKYIARMDADDISMASRFEIQIAYMIKNSLDICGGDFVSINESTELLNAFNVPKTQDEILIAMTNTIAFAHPSVIIRREFLIQNNLLYRKVPAEDIDLWMRMYNLGAKFGNVDDIVLKYRIVPNSLSHSPAKVRALNKNSIEIFNNFSNTNKDKIIKAIDNVIKNNAFMHKYRQRELIKSALTLKLSFGYIMKIFLKIRLINFIFGILSYVKFRL